jgi:eukaryotic-like serine/threonine-protein kinase
VNSAAELRDEPRAPLVLDRYELHAEIASGGMATVHVGRLNGAAGIARTVAIKRLHPTFAKDPDFAAMFLDEARVTTRIRHPNVVPTLDVVSERGELFLVMEFVLGESLAGVLKRLRERGERMPPRVAAAIASGLLHGLHAAHETRAENGELLGLVHRDVSPQNVLLGADGMTRVLDFGVAKAAGGTHTTREGEVKGKLAYMAQEQFLSADVDRRADVFAAAVVLWEALTSDRLFARDAPGPTINALLYEPIEPPSARTEGVPPSLDAVVLRGLERNPELRFATARDMAAAIEAAIDVASAREVGALVEATCGEVLQARARLVAAIEAKRPPDAATPPPFSRSTGVTAKSAFYDADATRVDGAPPKRRGVFPVALVATVVALALGAAITLTRSESAMVPSPTSATTAPSEAPVVAASPAPNEAASVTTTASAASSAAATPAAAPAPRPPRPRAATTATAAAAAAAAKPDCKIPFRIDADGIRLPRSECF